MRTLLGSRVSRVFSERSAFSIGRYRRGGDNLGLECKTTVVLLDRSPGMGERPRLVKRRAALRDCSKRPISLNQGHGKEAIPHRSYGRAVEAHRTLVASGQAGWATAQHEFT